MMYDTLEELKANHSCWAECGIMKLTVEAEEILPENRELILKNAYRDGPIKETDNKSSKK